MRVDFFKFFMAGIFVIKTRCSHVKREQVRNLDGRNDFHFSTAFGTGFDVDVEDTC